MKKSLYLLGAVLIVFSSCGNNAKTGQETTAFVDFNETESEMSETVLLEAMQNENKSEEKTNQAPFGEANKLIQSDVMETTFFTMRVDSVAVSDTVAEYTANEGMEFIVLDIYLENCTGKNDQILNGNVPMFATDFCLYWGDEKENGTYPANTGILEELPVEYELEDTLQGKLIFLIPKGLEMVYLVYEEYYTYGDINDSELMNTWLMKMMPVDWKREESVK